MIRAVWRGLLFGIVAVALEHGAAWAQPFYEFNGLRYVFPFTQTTGQLVNNGTGVLNWENIAPPGLIAWSKTGSCPSGWTEYSAGRGRLLVALVAGGTSGGPIGQALTNLENRASGQHTHVATTPVLFNYAAQTHVLTDPGHLHGGLNNAGGLIEGQGGGPDREFGSQNSGILTAFATTGITLSPVATGISVTGSLTVGNTPGTAGTNAPYLQLMACEKL
jgi:hypothetical protein